MTNSETSTDLWLEKIAELTKLEALGSKIWREGIGPYLYVGIFLFINTFVIIPLLPGPLHLIANAIGQSFTWAAAFFGIWATKKMNEKFQNVARKLDFSIRSVSFRLKLTMFLGGALVIIGWILVTTSVIPNPITGRYVQTNFGFSPLCILLYAIWIFGYLIVVSEFFSHYIGIHYTLPKHVKKEKPEIDYSDLERTGGMKVLGDVLLSSTKYYFGGLALFTFLPIAYRSLVGLGSIILFASGWIFGILMFVFPSFSIHSYVKEGKRGKMEELGKRIEETGGEGGRLVADPADRKELQKYLFLFLEHEHLYQMKEYPFDRSILYELIFAALVPIATQSVITLVF